MIKNPKQRLILYPKKKMQFNVCGMFCKTLDRANYIIRERNRENLQRAIFYDGEGVALELI